MASETAKHAVFDVQIPGHWGFVDAPSSTEFREQDDRGIFHVSYNTNSTLESAAIHVSDVVSEWSFHAMYHVTVWFGGVGNSVLVRDPVSLAFFLTSTLPGLKPFMKEHELNDF